MLLLVHAAGAHSLCRSSLSTGDFARYDSLPLLNIKSCACSVEPFGWVRRPEDSSPHSASTIQPEGDVADSAPEAAAAVCGDSEEVDTVVEEAPADAKATRKKARAAKPVPRKRGNSKKRKIAADSSACVEGGQAGEQSPAALDTATPAAGDNGSVPAAEDSARPTAKRRGRPAERSSEGARRIPGRLQPWACARCTLENPVCDQHVSAPLLDSTPVWSVSVPVYSEAVL